MPFARKPFSSRSSRTSFTSALLVAAVIGCGDPDDYVEKVPANSDLVVTRYAGQDTATPSVEVAAPSGATTTFWTHEGHAAGPLAQALYRDPRDQTEVRVFFDDNGAVSRVQDERSGAFLTVQDAKSSYTVLAHDAAGRFVGGHVVWSVSGRYYAAAIHGASPLSGQIRATLAGGDPRDLVAWTEDRLARGEATRIPQSIVSYLIDPELAAYVVGAGSLASLIGESPAGNRAAGGILKSLAGAITVFAGTQIPTIAVGTGAATIAPLLGAVVAIGGAYYIAKGGDEFRAGVKDMLKQAARGFGQGRSLAEVTADLGQRIAMKVRTTVYEPSANLIEEAQRKSATLRKDVQSLIQAAPLPKGVASLFGTVRDEAGTLIDVAGTIAPSGGVTLKSTTPAPSVEIAATVKEDGTVSGTYTGDLGPGTVSGAVEPEPTSCTAPQVLEHRRCVTPTVTCTPPQVLENGACVTPPVTCTPPQVAMSGTCVTPPTSCMPPQVMQNGACVSPPVIECAPPFVMKDGMCVSAPAMCTPPQVLENGMCVTPTTGTSINYIVVRRDYSAFKIYSTENYKGLTEQGALDKAKATAPAGSWEIELVSRQVGHGSMFCLDTVNGHYPPAYFHAEGKATSSEAVVESRAKAIAAAQGLNPSRSYYWCGTWVNR